MIVVVAVKQVLDPAVPVRIRRDGHGVERPDARPLMNPFDEIAVEAALRLREKGDVREVVVVGVGPMEWDGTLRTALAMGADRGCRVDAPESLEPLFVARILAALARREGASLVLTGRQGVDRDQGQTGPMIAGLLGWGQAAFAVEMRIQNDRVIVRREVDGGQETVNLAIPVVITVDLRMNTPRYASLPNIMRARSKPLECLSLESLGVSLPEDVEWLDVRTPPPRKPGIRVRDVAELATRLKALGLLS
ncbi:MAG: electron transfer flavoprotein subunit beta/FixA family protein [Magnetococcales bacterium]|nr:electron transfer flavoprotein subunit beta/FixA family protein [Magnetococcales bacterium]